MGRIQRKGKKEVNAPSWHERKREIIPRSPFRLRLAQNIDTERILEICPLIRPMRRELSPYRSVLFRRQPVVRMRDLDDPFFKLFKAIKVNRSGEETLPNEGEALVVDRPADRRKGGFSNFFFVVEKAQNFVECSRINRFGNPGETSRPQRSSAQGGAT